MLGYILGLLKGFGYLRQTGDLVGDNITRRLLQRILEKILDAPCRSTDDTEKQRTTCIRQGFWPPLKPKIESYFLTFSLYCFIR